MLVNSLATPPRIDQHARQIQSCEGLDADHQFLNAWLARVALSVKVVPAEGGAPGLCVAPAHTSYVASILASVANATSSDAWPRL